MFRINSAAAAALNLKFYMFLTGHMKCLYLVLFCTRFCISPALKLLIGTSCPSACLLLTKVFNLEDFENKKVVAVFQCLIDDLVK